MGGRRLGPLLRYSKIQNGMMTDLNFVFEKNSEEY